MVDRYTKAVLTVIAGALVVLCLQNAVSKATAQAGGCGGTMLDPCHVTEAMGPLKVYVTNIN